MRGWNDAVRNAEEMIPELVRDGAQGMVVSAARAGLPDTGLLSYAEMRDQGRDICSAIVRS